MNKAQLWSLIFIFIKKQRGAPAADFKFQTTGNACLLQSTPN